MGPIERELRTAPVENHDIWRWLAEQGQSWPCRPTQRRAYEVARDTATQHGGIWHAYWQQRLPDVLSDAIEFAASEGI